ncbi:MAG: histidinol-phosphate transaminase [Gallicola sp.]|nr:histidinol-phosphate transaminase [Gallicola sp.]
MTNFMRSCLRGFKEYQVAEIKEKFVINANENPNNIMEDEVIREKAVDILLNTNFNRYPDPTASELKKEIKDYLNCQDYSVIVGNGADEVISYITRTYLEPGDVVVTHTPTFEIYGLDTRIMDGKAVQVPDKANHIVDSKKIIEEANKNNAKLIFLCVPNNPTGYTIPTDELVEIVDQTEGLVLIDEAYVEFSEKDNLDLLKTGRVIILRTLSKAFGFAGLRLGYGISTPEIISCIEKVREPYNLNSFTQKMGVMVLQNRDRILAKNKRIIELRKELRDRLGVFKEVKIYDSQANFILVETKNQKELLEALKERSILAKGYIGREELNNCIRLTVTTEELNDFIVDAFEETQEKNHD